MKHYRCDECGKETGQNGTGAEPPIVLKGIAGTSGGILLPERFLEKHFCSPECFWDWADKHNINNEEVDC